MANDEKGRDSDRPLPELKKERDSFIHTFFTKGAQFTQELVNENTRLRHRIVELEQETAKLRAQVASDDAIRELLKKIEGLESEKGNLLSQFQQAEAASSRWVDQYTEVESELANFANLYVASHQLHASLSFRTTVRQIKELLEQLVGSRCFAVYLATADGKTLVPIVFEGMGKPRRIPVNPNDGAIGEVFNTGMSRVETGDLSQGSLEHPLALVPMTHEHKVYGVFAVYATLEQKPRFLPVDFELFKLLGAHAAGALVGAALFANAGQKIPSFDPFFDPET
ncbi:MAG: GAF domain-containing protein [Polyangiaceae bacterium]